MVSVESALMFLGAAVCHQLAERSYFLGDVQMPLCARCIGIHFGFLTSTALLLLGPRRSALGLPTTRSTVLLAAVMAFFLVDAGLSYSGVSTSDNLRRTLSGLALGVTLPFVVVPLLTTLSTAAKAPVPVLSRPLDWALLAGVYGLGAVLILTAEGSYVLFYGVSVLGIAGMFLFFGAIMAVVVQTALLERPIATKARLALASALAVSLVLALATIHEVFFPEI